MTATQHATRRMSQRGIRKAAIDFTLRWGRIYHRTGVVFYVLTRRDIERSKACDSTIRRWEGTTVLTDGDSILTVYKNRDVSHIRRKSEQDLKAFFGATCKGRQRRSS